MITLSKKTRLIALAVLGLTGIIGVAVFSHLANRKPVVLSGAVIREESDTNKEEPIAEVYVTASDGNAAVSATSVSSGFFHVILPKGVRTGQLISLEFRHSGYLTLHLNVIAGDRLVVAKMIPLPHELRDENGPKVAVSNIRVRYTVSSSTVVNIGSAVRTLQVANVGNVPCNFQPPCSPDGKWKAAVGSVSLDAGPGNQFRNARASCIAGPCPFTRIDPVNISDGGRTLKISARNWSETATFLVEAEVFHQMESGNVRESYPVIFGQALNFTLPGSAQGVSIEAEINGAPIVFPLGPDLLLSWAQCDAGTNPDQTRFYRCELKPGHRF